MTGFEPAASRSQGERSTKLSYIPKPNKVGKVGKEVLEPPQHRGDSFTGC